MRPNYSLSFIVLVLHLLLLASQPFILAVGNSFWMLGILIAILLVGVWVNKWGRNTSILKIIAIVVNIVCSVLYYYYNTPIIEIIYIGSVLLLIFFSLIVHFITVLKVERVDTSTIFSSISFYILGGYAGATAAWLVETISPGSFSINHPVATHQLFDFVYFSFVTMATLGYGDIIPANEIAKTLAIFISLFGQLYLTIFLVITLGKYMQQKKSNNNT
jgi:hypothetical protein